MTSSHRETRDLEPSLASRVSLSRVSFFLVTVLVVGTQSSWRHFSGSGPFTELKTTAAKDNSALNFLRRSDGLAAQDNLHGDARDESTLLSSTDSSSAEESPTQPLAQVDDDSSKNAAPHAGVEGDDLFDASSIVAPKAKNSHNSPTPSPSYGSKQEGATTRTYAPTSDSNSLTGGIRTRAPTSLDDSSTSVKRTWAPTSLDSDGSSGAGQRTRAPTSLDTDGSSGAGQKTRAPTSLETDGSTGIRTRAPTFAPSRASLGHGGESGDNGKAGAPTSKVKIDQTFSPTHAKKVKATRTYAPTNAERSRPVRPDTFSPTGTPTEWVDEAKPLDQGAKGHRHAGEDQNSKKSYGAKCPGTEGC